MITWARRHLFRLPQVKVNIAGQSPVPFYRNWSFYLTIINICITAFLSYYLSTINHRMAQIQDASFYPQLFVEFDSLRVFAQPEEYPESLIVHYALHNYGNTTALHVDLAKPCISLGLDLPLAIDTTGETPPFNAIAAGKSLPRSIRSMWSETSVNEILDGRVRYLHFFARYKDALDRPHRSHFVLGFRMVRHGDSYICQTFPELQTIE